MSSNQLSLKSKAIATTLGLVIGDALGTTLEFTKRDSQPLLTDIIGGGPFELPKGGWTDDTSMALAIADSLLESKKFDPEGIQLNFLDWKEDGKFSHNNRCFDIGGVTWEALTNFSNDMLNPWMGLTTEHSAANGGIMRLGPIFTFYAKDEVLGTKVAINQSKLTHAHPECLLYAQKCAEVVYAAYKGEYHPDLNKFKERQRDQVKSGGYVVDTYEAACWAISQTDNFKDALILAVNLGGDADTVGAVTGMLAGALYGFESLPTEWVKTILWSDHILKIANDLFESPKLT